MRFQAFSLVAVLPVVAHRIELQVVNSLVDRIADVMRDLPPEGEKTNTAAPWSSRHATLTPEGESEQEVLPGPSSWRVAEPKASAHLSGGSSQRIVENEEKEEIQRRETEEGGKSPRIVLSVIDGAKMAEASHHLRAIADSLSAMANLLSPPPDLVAHAHN